MSRTIAETIPACEPYLDVAFTNADAHEPPGGSPSTPTSTRSTWWSSPTKRQRTSGLMSSATRHSSTCAVQLFNVQFPDEWVPVTASNLPVPSLELDGDEVSLGHAEFDFTRPDGSPAHTDRSKLGSGSDALSRSSRVPPRTANRATVPDHRRASRPTGPGSRGWIRSAELTTGAGFVPHPSALVTVAKERLTIRHLHSASNFVSDRSQRARCSIPTNPINRSPRHRGARPLGGLLHPLVILLSSDFPSVDHLLIGGSDGSDCRHRGGVRGVVYGRS